MKELIQEASAWSSKILGKETTSIEKLRKEASIRDYYRVISGDQSFVLMDNFDDLEGATKFLYIGKLFRENNLPVPEVMAFSEDLKYLLLEDLGNEVLDQTHILSDEAILTKSICHIANIQNLPLDVLQSFSKESLVHQTFGFRNVFQYKGIVLTSKEEKTISNLRYFLVQMLMNQPFVPLHNDFERRNLILNKEEIYIIDFQDCCVGPMGIDLASILYEHDRNYDEELILSQIRSFLSKKSSNMKENKVLEYIFVALAHRSIRIVSTFVSYFLEGKLLNRKKDLEKFIIRIIFSLNKLNRPEEAQIIKKLL